MKKMELSLLKENVFDLIGKEWMLVTAGTSDCFNTMTASWGGIGFLWGKPVAFVFVRPERYTHDFIEQHERLTLAFLGEANRGVHKVCGSKSGRDTDKVKEAGLRPVETPTGVVTFTQARLTLECRKLYKAPITPEGILDVETVSRWYNDQPGGTYHDMYVVEIEQLYTGEE